MKPQSKETSCHCGDCREMCERVPCRPTPREAERLIAAGFGPQLMIRRFIAGDGEAEHDAEILTPAIVGAEGTSVNRWEGGRCVLLERGWCKVHKLGLKPIEGRMAFHNGHPDRDRHRGNILSRVSQLWDNAKGRAIIEAWRASLKETANGR